MVLSSLRQEVASGLDEASCSTTYGNPYYEETSPLQPCATDLNLHKFVSTHSNNMNETPALGPAFRSHVLPPSRRGGRVQKRKPIPKDKQISRKEPSMIVGKTEICIRCKKSKLKCSGGIPCDKCKEVVRGRIWKMPCIHADFLHVIMEESIHPYVFAYEHGKIRNVRGYMEWRMLRCREISLFNLVNRALCNLESNKISALIVLLMLQIIIFSTPRIPYHLARTFGIKMENAEIRTSLGEHYHRSNHVRAVLWVHAQLIADNMPSWSSVHIETDLMGRFSALIDYECPDGQFSKLDAWSQLEFMGFKDVLNMTSGIEHRQPMEKYYNLDGLDDGFNEFEKCRFSEDLIAVTPDEQKCLSISMFFTLASVDWIRYIHHLEELDDIENLEQRRHRFFLNEVMLRWTALVIYGEHADSEAATNTKVPRGVYEEEDFLTDTRKLWDSFVSYAKCVNPAFQQVTFMDAFKVGKRWSELTVIFGIEIILIGGLWEPFKTTRGHPTWLQGMIYACTDEEFAKLKSDLCTEGCSWLKAVCASLDGTVQMLASFINWEGLDEKPDVAVLLHTAEQIDRKLRTTFGTLSDLWTLDLRPPLQSAKSLECLVHWLGLMVIGSCPKCDPVYKRKFFQHGFRYLRPLKRKIDCSTLAMYDEEKRQEFLKLSKRRLCQAVDTFEFNSIEESDSNQISQQRRRNHLLKGVDTLLESFEEATRRKDNGIVPIIQVKDAEKYFRKGHQHFCKALC
ncbi:hypothetical protein B0J11DRAFT_529994 [Dendryphion nanum]|uniref:Zn(2)-C6 fungal-type domain-containing protein n=1 Tax=Dendryphion nanum TaxID=256645 RepID=A0A9P9DQB3_9PLEO|nr:hypothetical protein B0J11DRAFT_529994 [Dendryphion nanum]